MDAYGAAWLQAAHQPLSLTRGLRLPNLPTGNKTQIQHIDEVHSRYFTRTGKAIWVLPIFLKGGSDLCGIDCSDSTLTEKVSLLCPTIQLPSATTHTELCNTTPIQHNRKRASYFYDDVESLSTVVNTITEMVSFLCPTIRLPSATTHTEPCTGNFGSFNNSLPSPCSLSQVRGGRRRGVHILRYLVSFGNK
jgi:hypothetical protein